MITREGRQLVTEVRSAAAIHKRTWEELVPNHIEINLEAEHAEEAAFSDMAQAKARLREHICQTYGISARELCGLAMP